MVVLWQYSHHIGCPTYAMQYRNATRRNARLIKTCMHDQLLFFPKKLMIFPPFFGAALPPVF